MIDFAKITVKAGNGGRGAGAFAHIKGKRLGKANGGDGGRGGDVYIAASLDVKGLETFRYNKDFTAANGQNGDPNKRKGAEGEDLVLKVPVGTLVKVMSQSDESGLSTLHSDFDLITDGQKVLVARGGEGGRGNAHLRDSFGRRPKAGEVGQEGEYLELTLELKLIADVGLIGLPNAGKSTLLTALTSARPAIADYPFTTLEPNLGVLSGSSVMVYRSSGKRKKEKATHEPLTINDTRLVIADIPGLIEGASEGKGLGHLFLRHIERTKILVHMIDVSGSTDPVLDYRAVRAELKKYSPELAKKKEIVVLNKVDLVGKEVLDQSRTSFKKMRKRVVLLSAETGEGLHDLVLQILKILV